MSQHIRHCSVARPFYAGQEGITPFLMLDVEQIEVSGKAFAEPNVIPIAFSNCIPEPMMRNLVSRCSEPAKVEDGGCRFRCTTSPGGFYLRKFLVGERTYMVAVELKDRGCFLIQRLETSISVLWEYPSGKLGAMKLTKVFDRHSSDSEVVLPTGNRLAFLPCCTTDAIWQARLFCLRT